MDRPGYDLTRHIEEIVEPVLTAMGYNLVRVQVSGKKRVTLQIMAERLDGAGMTVDDCAAISREISPILDVDDPIKGEYSLEVSSPGIDRPLVRREDFERFAGFEIKAELDRPLDNRRRFQGRLMGLSGDAVLIQLGDGTAELPLADIRHAKLVLTDELLKAHTRPPA